METISSIAALCSSIAAFITIIVTIKNARKAAFISVVTAARNEYIQELRKILAEFCHLATTPALSNNDVMRLNNLKYLIYLHLNPSDWKDEWDGQIVDLINKITNQPNNSQSNVAELLKVSESLFKLEWEGLTREGANGVLTLAQKDALRKKHWENFKK